MKQAEYWRERIYRECHSPVMGHSSVPCDFIEQIQLDALKHGMTLAADIAKETPVVCLSEKNAILSAREDILNARNEKASV